MREEHITTKANGNQVKKMKGLVGSPAIFESKHEHNAHLTII